MEKEEKKEEEYVSEILLELQPRSRRGYRRLFGIRENKFLNKESFDRIAFTKIFLNKYNKKVVKRGEHIICDNLIIGVKQIKRNIHLFNKYYFNYILYIKKKAGASSTYSGNTRVEFLIKGLPFGNEEKGQLDNKIMDNKRCLNEYFISDLLTKSDQTNINLEVEQVYSCYCSQCKKGLIQGDFYIKSGNWSRPIICLSCYYLLFTYKCTRCKKSITFDHKSLTSDGLTSIRFVEHKNFYWHSDCCVCVTCLQSLIGQKFYQDQIYNQLFCLQHIPHP
ncbi:unnamed protein product [Rotaria sordida]|uniref:LIM zinc-binding domain-containing protein n=1 Tax=Rotaria sordida TaxID=392033 RepID=A0A815CIL3_9BILA|nr:unnamed protein product [Rotaria sordida]CAF1284246.1 unnamed protein product [Rotaria sordida]